MAESGAPSEQEILEAFSDPGDELDDEVYAGDEAEPPRPRENPALIPAWLRRLREKAKASALRPSQAGTFLAAVELDEERPASRKLGLKPLFEAYCERGQPHWLDPARALKPLTDILERYQGSTENLRFIMVQALSLARSGLSPDAFVRHVVLPRMRNDADWRNWRLRHSVPIASIAQLILAMRAAPPFDALHLGQTDVLSDVALAKYVGRPLCRLSADQWSRLEPELAGYREAWLRLRFSSRRYLLFLRQNVLPFLYRLSGFIDPQQLVPIVKAASELEPPFSQRLDALPAQTADHVLGQARLFQDLERAIVSGRDRGEPWLSFAKQLAGYLTVVSALVSTNSGLTLLSRVATILRRKGDPLFPEACARMIGLIRDLGGTLALSWHIDRLKSLPHEQRQGFLEEIGQNGGFALDYPYREAYLRNDDDERERTDTAARLCSELGIADQARAIMAQGKRSTLSLAIAYEAYAASSPGRRALGDGFLDGAARGADRLWDSDDIARFDSDGPAGHELLMRRLIRGLGSGFSAMTLKTESLASLSSYFKAANSQSLPELSYEFELSEGSDSAESRLSSLDRDELRKRVGLDFISKIVEAFASFDAQAPSEEPFETDCFAAFGKLQRDVRKGFEPLQDKLAKLEAQLAGLKAEGMAAEAGELDSKNRKLRQSALAAGKRLAMFDRLFAIKEDDGLGTGERFAAAIHACAFVSKPGEETAVACLRWALKRYADKRGLSERLSFIKADVSSDFVSLEQLSFIIDCLDSLCAAASQDPALLKAVGPGAGPELASFLRDTSQLAGGRVCDESLDAALRKVSGSSRLEGERTKWKEMVDRSDRSDRDARRYETRLSKSFLDAYYGDFGGICLSGMPDLIVRPGFYPIRLIDKAERQVVGVALAAYCANPGARFGAQRYWLAFAFNPLRSLSRKWNARQLLAVYLSFRRILENLSKASGMPVLLAGMGANGILSNNVALQSLIVNYERTRDPVEVQDARGFHAMYPESQFARALLVIRPDEPASMRSATELEPLLRGEGPRRSTE